MNDYLSFPQTVLSQSGVNAHCIWIEVWALLVRSIHEDKVQFKLMENLFLKTFLCTSHSFDLPSQETIHCIVCATLSIGNCKLWVLPSFAGILCVVPLFFSSPSVSIFALHLFDRLILLLSTFFCVGFNVFSGNCMRTDKALDSFAYASFDNSNAHAIVTIFTLSHPHSIRIIGLGALQNAIILSTSSESFASTLISFRIFNCILFQYIW